MKGDGQRPLSTSDRLIVTKVHNGRSPQQPSLFTNGHGQAKSNGAAVVNANLNGKRPEHDENDEADKPAVLNKPAPPPVPRPRLFFEH